MHSTLTPHINTHLTGRLRRGEIAPVTARDLRYTLSSLDRSFGRRPLNQLGPKAIDRWLESIGHLAPATRREYLSRVRVFCAWLLAEGLIRKNPTAHVPAIRQPRRRPITLTEVEVARLLLAAPDLRARAVVWLMVGCGARCVEVSRATVEDYEPRHGTLLLRGKGGHERMIPVPTAARDCLDRYLDTTGRASGPLIRSEVNPQALLSPATLSQYMRKWMRAAGVKTRALDGRSAHGLRRTALSDVMDRTSDVRVVQEMAGHRDLDTTARHYLRPVTLDQLRTAMEGRDYAA
ncbi:tyrosine-type recombinase/integrase [Iamia majanohamensis]|uniref:Tyrosine-type recombinase/integrase n=1 Tax=Iamia majanohamensis TaxID=467976 RepID=A0AAE9YHG6_9ACTN|nr:tyrosine-type recombinase/integrase [Iamia majanohamensis]WCO67856.1 tyrosine-type recombinase/integrase [Iamia majanohamensis]